MDKDIEIRVIIVDDEPDACSTLKSLISKYIDGVKVVDVVHNVDAAADSIVLHKPDLIFLDIEMPNGNGFTLFDKIKQVDFEVVFATAYDQYAIQAIKYSALDYLLKPFDLRELKIAIQKAGNKRNLILNQQRIEVLLENLHGGGGMDRLAMPTHDGFIFVNVNNVVRLHSDGSYTNVHMFNGDQHLISKPLGEMEELFPKEYFFRIHRGTIINVRFVRRYTKTDGQQVIMEDGAKLDVSHRRKDEFLKYIRETR